MRLLNFILFVLLSFNLLAQAELDKVRAMFPEPNHHIQVEIWKGHMENAHPVEFYFAREENELKGYYRIISSGEEFFLEGEMSGSAASISEYSSENVEIGIFHSEMLKPYQLGEKIVLKWYNLEKKDILDFRLEAVRFSYYPKGLFHPKVIKFSRYENDLKENILIEQLNEKELFFHHSYNHNEESFRLKVKSNKPFDFECVQNEQLHIYDEINGKLRKRTNGGISFYEQENELEIQPLTYASSDFLCNIEYPETESQAFNKWISSMIQKRRDTARKLVKEMVEADDELSSSHFGYKWNSWTEVDYLSDNIVCGRMVFINSWEDEVETFSFIYDLRKEKSVEILEEFKSDFNMRDYLDKFIQSELIKFNKQNLSDDYELELKDYTELSISDNHLIISTKFNWLYGYHKMKIPFSELEGLLKRNSILKPIMKS